MSPPADVTFDRSEPPRAGSVTGRRQEVAGKLRSLRAWLDERGLQAALLGSQANFAWMTAGGRSHVSLGDARGVASVLVTLEAAYMITSNIETRRIGDEETGDLAFESVEYRWDDPEGLEDAVAALCDPSRAVTDLEGSPLLNAAEGLAPLRYVLSPGEVNRYSRLGRDAADGVEIACRETDPGERELDVAARIAFECERRDILPLVNLVAADERIARYRHPIPTPARIRQTLLVALTGRRHGLHASLTRMVSFGRPDSDFTSRHQAVCRVDARLILESRRECSLGEVVRRGMDQYAEEGFAGEWELHHQGGLTGYAGREIFATPASSHRLGAGQALAWNPSITRVKSEDTVLVTDDGAEVLTQTGGWPQHEIRLDVGSLRRPAVLEKGAS